MAENLIQEKFCEKLFFFMAEDPDFTWDELEPLVRPTPVFAFAAGIGQGNVYIVRTQLWGEGRSGLCILGRTRGEGGSSPCVCT